MAVKQLVVLVGVPLRVIDTIQWQGYDEVLRIADQLIKRACYEKM